MKLTKITIFLLLLLKLSLSNTPLINELTEALNRQLEDETVSPAQYQYIINELKDEPDCKEIQLLFTLLQSLSSQIQDLIDENCRPGESSTHETPVRLPVEKHLLATVSGKAYPEKNSLEPLVLKGRARTGGLEGLLDYDFQKSRINKRTLSLQSANTVSTAGNFRIPDILPFVQGRSFWAGQKSAGDSAGMLFTDNAIPNGLLFMHSSDNLSTGYYGTWNRNILSGGILDCRHMGTFAKFSSSALTARTQHSATDFDFGGNAREFYSVHGISLEETLLKVLSCGAGYSWNSRSANLRSVPSNLYGELMLRAPENRSFFRLFQASSNWINPLMTYTSRTMDSTLSGILLEGRGEGGFQINHSLSLYQAPSSRAPFNSRLEVSTEQRWSVDDSDFYYRRVGLQVLSRYGGFSHALHTAESASQASRYTTIQNTIRYRPVCGATFSSAYTHQSEGYAGTYRRVLELKAAFRWSGQYNTRCTLLTRDILRMSRQIDFLLFQTWTLSENLYLDWSAKVPFEEWEVTADMYYQGQFRLQI